MANNGGLSPITPPPNYRKSPMQPGREMISNNYYYSDGPAPTPWYRRPWFFWASLATLLAVLAICAVVLGVVLRRDQVARFDTAAETDAGKSGLATAAVTTSPKASTSTHTSTTPAASSSLSHSSSSSSHSSSSSSHSSSSSSHSSSSLSHSFSSSSHSSSSSSHSSSSAETGGPMPPVNETAKIETLRSILAPLTSHNNKGGPTASAAPSSSSASTWTASTSAARTRSLASTQAVEPTFVPFTPSETSCLASVYVAHGNVELRRRLVVWQDEKSELVVTEWVAGTEKTHSRLRDKLGSSLVDAKHGTSLAAVAGESGVVHLFFLDTKGAVVHLVEAAAGRWRMGDLVTAHGPVIPDEFSPLSAAWHSPGGRRGERLLVLAYETAQQTMRLVATDRPEGEGLWEAFDVTSMPTAVPGQTDLARFSLAGDWPSTPASVGAEEGSERQLLMAIWGEAGVVAWACSVNNWPPPGADLRCRETEETLQDETGRGLGFGPAPRQLGWVRLDGGSGRQEEARYDTSLVHLDADGSIKESHVAAGAARQDGAGIKTEVAFRALSTTDEGVVFATSKEELLIYRLDRGSWTWKLEGSLLS
ncbi:hypothetical protein RJ55_07251 [Drechmeria coniospora]|nr:hypothetical protein RJ55_07251 [Drechmeria coniospora]